MSKKILTISAALLFVATAFAVPAKRVKQQVQQPDGTMLTIMMRGDENFHFISTEDGEPLVKAKDGYYYYALVGDDGKIMASAQMAHDTGYRTAAEQTFLATYAAESLKVRSLGAKRAAKNNARRMERLAKRNLTNVGYLSSATSPMRQQMSGATGGEGIGVTGKRKGLVILVNFKDKKIQDKHTREEYDNFFNQEGYNKLGNSGSVHDYFYNQSYGQFDLTFDVVGPVTVSKNMADYGANDSDGNDIDPAGMVTEACKLAYDEYKMDMSQYDWDGDGAVDQVFLIYAGYSEASYGGDDTIWPHEWDISSAGYSLVLGGKRIRTYGCSSELSGNTGTDMDGIGTPCHEFSHCLGIPDIYDTSDDYSFSMGKWDVMDYGSYSGDGRKPVGYNTYEKWVSGWIQPTVLTDPCYIKDMKPLSESPEAYVAFNDKTPTEYYIFENRQNTVNDTEIPAHGMLVIHVDYDQKAWNENVLNNEKSHKRLAIVPADNVASDYTTNDDTYPGTTRNTQLTDTSRPAATLFNVNVDGRKFLGKPVTDIYESTDGQISFTFMGGETLDVPADLTTADFNSTGFTASWSAVENAESYNVELREKTVQASTEECLAIAEDMTEWGSGQKSDATKDLSSDLDYVMANKGWTGTKVFEGVGGAKLGSAKAAGNLTSPLLSADGGNVTVRLQAKPYGNDDATVTVSLTDEGDATIASESVVVDGTMSTISLANSGEKNYHVSISPNKRCYVQKVAAYNGDFDDSDFESADNAPALSASMASPVLRASQKFSDIKSTSYSFSGLKADGIYQWRVQSAKDNVVSDWSQWQVVDMSSQTSIKTIKNDSRLSDSTLVGIYSLSGVCLGTSTYAEFCADARLRGVYVLQYDGGAVRVVK